MNESVDVAFTNRRQTLSSLHRSFQTRSSHRDAEKVDSELLNEIDRICELEEHLFGCI